MDSGKGMLIVYSGPSGVGKGTIRKKVFERFGDKLFYSISMTTRAPREGEIDGVDYYFVTREYFEEQIEAGNFLEYAEFVGNYYGTPKDKVEKKLNNGYDVMLEIEVDGATQVKQKVEDAISIFVVPPSMEALENRLQGRKTEEQEIIQKRLEKARREIVLAGLYDYVVINDDLEEATEDVVSIIKSGHLKTPYSIPAYCKELIKQIKK
ncbi:MAG: guanylate kinase [Clostridiales bacterium]|nr:guanylate kinase [Clostridiales bacterium]